MKQGETLFDIWGGVRRMAADLARPVGTVGGWKKAGRIPAGEQPHVLEMAQKLRVPITAEHVVYPLGRPDAVTETLAAIVGTVVCDRASILQQKDHAQ